MGTIGWHDLTVPPEQTEAVRDFYAAVLGWTPEPVPMGDYSDFTMNDSAGNPAGGVCHGQGTNEGMPAQWILYTIIPDLEASLAICREKGGELLVGPKSMGDASYAVIRDPAGAVMGLYQP